MEKGKLALKQEHRPERSIFDSTSVPGKHWSWNETFPTKLPKGR